MTIKYPLGTIIIRSINNDYGVVINVKGEKKSYPIYTVYWSKRSSENMVVYDYKEDELDRWYKKV